MKNFRIATLAALAALAGLAPYTARADGLVKATGIASLVLEAPKAGAGHQSSTPVPLAPGKFIVPFAGSEIINGNLYSAARYQAVDSTFAKTGNPMTLFASNGNGCCANFAANGGAMLGGKTQIVLPMFTYTKMGEVFGISVAASGTPVPDDIVSLTRAKDGNQSAPVVLPLPGGTAFVMWTDFFHETGESDSSVRGALIGTNGRATGPDILLEGVNTGYQVPADATRLKNGRMLAIYKTLGANDVFGRTIFYGRLLNAAGQPVGGSILLGANNENLFSAEMRVAALPNGNFVVVWVDDRLGVSVPFFRIFSPTGEATGPAERVGQLTDIGGGVDVAALADGRFVVTANLMEEEGIYFVAQLFDPVGRKLGSRLALRTLSTLDGVLEQYVVNVGYLLGTAPPAGGLASASDPRRVYVSWRVDRPGSAYNLYAQVLRADP